MSKESPKAILITLMILISMFSFIFSIPPVCSTSSNDLKTFYFQDVLSIYSDSEYNFESDLGYVIPISDNPPIKTNDSFYPPQIINGLSFNYQELTTWATSTWLYYFIDQFSEEYEIPDEFADFFESYQLLLPNPLRIVESYENNGSETIDIDGSVNFNLFLSSKILSKSDNNDKINVGLYSLDPILPIPIKIDNRTIDIDIDLLKNIKNQKISLNNISYKLKPGENLLFVIELIPGNKTITDRIIEEKPILKNITKKALEIVYDLANNSNNQNLNDFIEIIDTFQEVFQILSDEMNFTIDDLSIVINSLISTSLVYDSEVHPSSVSVPFIISNDGYINENKVTYYLHSDYEMNNILPNSNETSIKDLSNKTRWNGPILERSKIIKNANAQLFINYKDLNFLSDNIIIVADLVYNDQVISSSQYALDKTLITNKLITFDFDEFNNNQEIEYSNNLALELSLSNSSNINTGILRIVELYYDSIDYASKLNIIFEDTDNIDVKIVSNPTDGKIIPGDTVNYTLDISSVYNDNIEIIEISYDGNKDFWNIIIPNKFDILAGENKSVNIIITSTEYDISLYNERIDILLSVQGKTGKKLINISALISEEAVTYDIDLIIPPNKDIKHGNSASYYFILKNNNTGLWPDSYLLNASSENNWNISIKPSLIIENLDAGDSIEINVTLFVPKDTNVKKDNLTLRIESENSNISKVVIVTSNIIGPNFIEDLYNYFDSLARDLGLFEIFGDYAPHALISIIFLLIFIIIIISMLILTSRFVDIVCVDRIKEISPTDSAVFDISLKNITKKNRDYLLSVKEKNNDSKWFYSLDSTDFSLSPKESKNITLKIESNDLIQSEDWAKFELLVNTIGKKRKELMTFIVSIIDSKSDIKIRNLTHWPKLFKHGERIVTTFLLNNNGNVSSNNLSIFFYLNGKEKNKLENVIIPAKGFAEIKIPWIAVKGKNEISITVRKY